MSLTSRRDYWKRIYPRRQQARGEERGSILDEFCANCGYRRKHAIRLLNGSPPGGKPLPRRRRRRDATYGPQVISVLKAVWGAVDIPWSVRLKRRLPKHIARRTSRFSGATGSELVERPEARTRDVR